MPRITTFLTYDDGAEDAAKLYVSLFPNSRIGQVARYGAAGPGREGSVMTVEFVLDGQVMDAMLKMKKIVIDDLQRAYDGR